MNTIIKKAQAEKNINLQPIPTNNYSYFTLENQIKLPRTKQGKSSKYLISFFAKILGVTENKLTDSISESVIELDNLAIRVDSLLDSPFSELKRGASLHSFDSLENEIVDCFSPLVGLPELNNLIKSTIDYVGKSFICNTKKRHIIYSINKKAKESNICTTLYLLPLVKYLGFINKSLVDESTIEKIFVLTSNYIQLVDDFVDIFDDISNKNATPVTSMFYSLCSSQNCSEINETPFEGLAKNVYAKLNSLCSKIKIEILLISDENITKEVLKDVFEFQRNLKFISIPKENNLIEFGKYLTRIKDIVPPIVCYAS